MHRGQRDHLYQGLATVEQGGGAQGAQAHQMSLPSSNRSDPFALSQKQPSQRYIDGYFSTASGKSQQQHKLNSNTLSEYFTENKDLAATYDNNISDGFEDLDVHMTEMTDDDGNFVMKTEEKLQLPHTVPNISSAMNTLSSVTGWMAPSYQHQPQGGSIKSASMPRVSANHDSFGPPQRVPVMHIHRGSVTTTSNAVRRPSRANGPGSGADKKKDPTKSALGGIRLRSISHATSVQQVLDGSMVQSNPVVDDDHEATAVLVEVIGTLCSPMVHEGFCWNSSVRNPSRQDYVDKHPLSPPPSMVAAPPALMTAQAGLQSVSCQLFDMGNTLNLEILEQGELIRAIGVISSATKREWEMGQEKRKEIRLLCVACRRATADEARLTIEGSTRCPPTKSA
ncbi:hypothetical protein BG000_001664 [Podila horticola]|nr:hypothetical protein BG000_001664 [Podila horticola]